LEQSAVPIQVSGAEFLVAANPRYASFWHSMRAGAWEPETFAAFREHIRPDIPYFEIGSWIGPTVLYAAHLTHRVVAVEPDPVACAALLANLALNPSIADRTQVFATAVGLETGLLDLRTQEFGDSMTSALPGRGGRIITVSAIGIDAFFARTLKADRSAFLKIDIEGAEYDVVPSICNWLTSHDVRADLFVSMHGHFFNDGMEANLARHYALLGRLAAFGEIRIWNGSTWSPDHVTQALTDGLARTGGLYATVLVKGR
jgi:FkbM family methyltransferase